MSRGLSKAEIYKHLARQYNWTFDQIADMSPYRQLLACGWTEKTDAIVFENIEDYERFRKSNV